MRAELEIENEEVIIYFIYQPSGVLAPVQGNCETFVETYGSNFFFLFSFINFWSSFLFSLIDCFFHFCVDLCLFFFLWIVRWKR